MANQTMRRRFQSVSYRDCSTKKVGEQTSSSAVTGSLERLRGTMLVWTRSYRSKDRRVEDMETVYVNILSKLKIVRRKVDGHITTEAGYFQFDDHILKNLLTKYTKPFLFDVFIDIRGEIALKLYSYLDLIMADKSHFERCTRDLFEDLGLKGASYRNPSKRKQNLEKAFAELTGNYVDHRHAEVSDHRENQRRSGLQGSVAENFAL